MDGDILSGSLNVEERRRISVRLGAGLAGVGLFLIASVACGLAPTVGVLIAARAVQAAGAAALVHVVY